MDTNQRRLAAYMAPLPCGYGISVARQLRSTVFACAFGFEGKRTVCDVKVNRVLGAAFNIIYSTTISQRPFPRVDYPSWVRDPLQGNKMLLQH